MLLRAPGPAQDGEAPAVFLRPSQRKIVYASHVPSHALDAQRNILEVLRPAQTRSPSRVSAQAIVYLVENGVPRSAIRTLFEESIDKSAPARDRLLCVVLTAAAVFEDFGDWGTLEGRQKLAMAIDRVRAVLSCDSV